jgi:DNA-binding NtrC family response regulator
MSDLDKLDKVQGFVDKWVTWAKQNTMIAGIVITGIPAVGAFGYNVITKDIEIIAFDKNAKIVMITSHGEQEKVIKAIQSGASNYLLKPLKIDKLKEVLDKLI